MKDLNYLIVGASSDMGRALIKKIDRELSLDVNSANSAMDNSINEIATSSSENEVVTIYAHYNSGKAKLEALEAELKNVKLVYIQADLSKRDGAAKLLSGLKCTAEKNASIKGPGAILDGAEQIATINRFVFMPAYPFNYMRLKELNLELLETEMNISAYSFLEISKELLPVMRKIENSKVLVMLTKYVTDELPPKFMVDYVVSKYALMGAVKSLQAEMANKNLSIDYVAPDMVETAFLNNIDPRIIEMNKAAGGILQPEDVAEMMYKKL